MPVHFRRTIRFETDQIIIKDVIENRGKEVYELKAASNISLRHVASGKFFTTSDLLEPAGKEQYSLRERVALRIEINLADGTIKRYETKN